MAVEDAMKGLALATVIAVALTSPALAQPSIAILTGSTSGVYYPLGNAISAIFLKGTSKNFSRQVAANLTR